MQPFLKVDQVTKRFHKVVANDRVSFDVMPGELFAIIGPNGAGKTSIFNCINGTYRPSSGSIRLDGVEIVGRRPSAIAARGLTGLGNHDMAVKIVVRSADRQRRVMLRHAELG